ncbi:testis-expressed protein 26-like [Danio aesculapii]|uniref:testis-expressed protein 26-like n=1 Tax=Danio aesculapii TaxID=1142201 RepID=UPI0024C01BF3|nr:testis-expressed protein 26-like [Danio aesculapii]
MPLCDIIASSMEEVGLYGHSVCNYRRFAMGVSLPVSRSLLDDPVGATVYSEDFCWRPVPKTACIRSATASGNRSNNPHPSKAFLIWRHYTDQMKQFDGSSPLQLHFTEKEIQKALSDQYRSTYKSDFLGLPQVIMKKHAFIVPFNHNQAVHYFTQTEMRHNYRSPIIKPELLGNTTRYGCNKLHGVAARGIVPTVDHSRIDNQERSKLQSTYNKHFGRKYTDVSSELKSVPPVLQFCKTLANKGNLRLRCALSLSSLSHRSCSKTSKQPLRRRKVTLRRRESLSDLSRYATRQENSGLICWSPT